MFTLAVALMLASLRKLGVLMLLLGTLVGGTRRFRRAFSIRYCRVVAGLVDKRVVGTAGAELAASWRASARRF